MNRVSKAMNTLYYNNQTAFVSAPIQGIFMSNSVKMT